MRQAQCLALRGRGLRRPCKTRPDSRKQDQLLRVVALCSLRLHRLTAEEGINGGVPRRHRVSPRRILSRGKPHRRQDEAHLFHSQFGIDRNVQLLSSKRLGNHRWTSIAAVEGARSVGLGGDRRCQSVAVASERIDAELETLAIEIGKPSTKIQTHRPLA